DGLQDRVGYPGDDQLRVFFVPLPRLDGERVRRVLERRPERELRDLLHQAGWLGQQDRLGYPGDERRRVLQSTVPGLEREAGTGCPGPISATGTPRSISQGWIAWVTRTARTSG